MNQFAKQMSQFKNCKVKHSIFNIKDHIPSTRKPVFASYDNKTLSKWKHDDFADYVFDQCHEEYPNPEKQDITVYTLAANEDSFLWDIPYLEHIPSLYTRVYLYGVWDIVKDVIKANKDQ
jgi:hypothetical protein